MTAFIPNVCSDPNQLITFLGATKDLQTSITNIYIYIRFEQELAHRMDIQF